MGDTLSQQQQHDACVVGSCGTGGGCGVVGGGGGSTAPVGGAGTPGTWVAPGELCEPALLSQLVQLLGQRPQHALLLSDLGALLPGPLRHGVKEKGGLRCWLQKYPELFQVSGQPGKESVTLLLGAVSEAATANAAAVGSCSAPLVGIAPGVAEPGACSAELHRSSEDEENESAVQLRGLPYRATVADIRQFLGAHVAALRNEHAIQLILNRDGRPSGFARVQFCSASAALAARHELHMRNMEVPGQGGGSSSGYAGSDRYVEVFLFSDRPNKLRFKKTEHGGLGGGAGGDGEDSHMLLGISKEEVIQQCRNHMKEPGQGQLLLSMLGVALSPNARIYLKKTDQGLKHFLSQYPQEFTVEGAKGREMITYLPTAPPGTQQTAMQACMVAASGGAGMMAANMPASMQASMPASMQAMSMPEQHSGWAMPATAGSCYPTGPLQSPKKPADSYSASYGPGAPASYSLGAAMRANEDLVPESPGMLHGTPKVARPGDDEHGHGGGVATPSDWGTPLPGRSAQRSALEGGQAGALLQSMDAGSASSQSSAAAAAAAAAYNGWSAWGMPPANWQNSFMQPPSNMWHSQEAAVLLGGEPGAARLGGGAEPSGMWGEGFGGRSCSAPFGGDSAAATLLSFAGAPAPPDNFAAFIAAAAAQTQSAADIAAAMQAAHAQQEAQAPHLQPQSFAMPPPAAQQAQQAQQAKPQQQPQPLQPVYSGVPPTWAVRLRGLPFNAQEQDVLAFFGKHEVVEHISEDEDAVQMIPKASGKPSGQAVVKMMSRADAEEVMKVLNGQYMGTRYIEVYHNQEVDNRGLAAAPQPSPPTGLKLTSTTHRDPCAAGLGGLIGGGGTGDTGGSDSAEASVAAAAAAAAQRQWLGAMGGGALGQACGGALGGLLKQEPGLGLGAAATCGVAAGGQVAGAGASDGVGERAWEALFGFLRQDMPHGAAPSGAPAPPGPLGLAAAAAACPAALLPGGLSGPIGGSLGTAVPSTLSGAAPAADPLQWPSAPQEGESEATPQ